MVTVGLTEARDRLGQLVNQVELQSERVTIERYGRPVAVLISPAAAELFEQLEDWIDARLGEAALEKALAEGTLPYDEVAKELGL